MVNYCLLNALTITFIVICVLIVIYLISLFIGEIIRRTKSKIGTLKWSIDSARECGEYAHRRIDDIHKAIFDMHNEIEKLKGEKKNVKKKKRN